MGCSQLFRFLIYLNRILAGGILCAIATAIVLWLLPASPPQISTPLPGYYLPPRHFYSQEELIGPSLSLQGNAITPSLENLQNEFVFYGTNQRPDAPKDAPELFIGIRGSPDFRVLHPGETCLLRYLGHGLSPCLEFCQRSEEVSETAGLIGIKAHLQGKEVLLQAGVLNSLDESPSYEQFILQERDYYHTTGTCWEIGNSRVNSAYFVREQAHVFGEDLFMTLHGGSSYEHCKNKFRFESGNEGSIHCCYVGEGDALVWSDGCWKEAILSSETQNKPLLLFKKRLQHSLSFDLWDSDGKSHIPLQLVLQNSFAISTDCLDKLRFICAKSWKHFVVETEGERLSIVPCDWLLYDGSKWRKLATKEEIDDYVSRKLIGELFVCNRVIRKKGEQKLKGRLFNAARTEVVEVELSSNNLKNNLSATMPSEPNDNGGMYNSEVEDAP